MKAGPAVARVFRKLLFVSLVLCSARYGWAQTYTFSTFAGPPGSAGWVDGPVREARFTRPWSMVADSAGNVFIVDDARLIRKLTPQGVVSTLGDGNGEFRFASIFGLAVDAGDNLYVAEYVADAVRKITRQGVVSTLANGASGLVSAPQGIAVGRDGTIYVSFNDGVAKIGADGKVTLWAGAFSFAPVGDSPGIRNSGSIDGTGTGARFSRPTALAIDPAGNVLVADVDNDTIRKIDPAGNVTTLAGVAGARGNTDGAGSTARFGTISALTMDPAGNLLVADSGNNNIRKVTPAGAVTTVGGVNYPTGIAIGPGGVLYAASQTDNTVVQLTPGAVATTLAGIAPTALAGSVDAAGHEARFNAPEGLATDTRGGFVVADTRNNTIRHVAVDGSVTTVAGLAGNAGFANGTAEARFNQPAGVAVGLAGVIYVADRGNHCIRSIGSTGLVATFAGTPGIPGSSDGTNGAFSSPTDVAVDAYGNVYVADSGNHTIRRITPGVGVSTLAGLAGSTGTTDGVGDAARFLGPTGVAVDGSGMLFVADKETVRSISPAGAVSTLATLPTYPRYVGAADAAGIAVDGAGNVFITDRKYHRILKFRSGQGLSLVSGETGPFGGGGFNDGTGQLAQLNTPSAIAVDGSGQLFVADTANHVIRKATPFARLKNLSVRALAGIGAGTVLAGFALAEPDRQQVSSMLYIRAVGPTLTSLGVKGALADPTLRVDFASGGTIAENNDWDASTFAGWNAIIGGAFPLQPNSKDAALITYPLPGNYVAQIGGATAGGGILLAEVYDVAPDNVAARLVNLSCRANVGTGENVVIAGFVVGDGPGKKLLIRGVGPGLAPYGVMGALANPRLQVFRDAELVATNSGWGGGAELAAAFRQAGAFPLASYSADAALIILLPPGAYTAQLSGVGGTTGIGLIEIYEFE